MFVCDTCCRPNSLGNFGLLGNIRALEHSWVTRPERLWPEHFVSHGGDTALTSKRFGRPASASPPSCMLGRGIGVRGRAFAHGDELYRLGHSSARVRGMPACDFCEKGEGLVSWQQRQPRAGHAWACEPCTST